MRAFLDTNVPIRHLTGDPPDQARRSTSMLAGAHRLIVTDVILAEVVFVLESFYRLGRSEITSLARALLALPSVDAPGLDPLLRALELYELTRLDFAEAHVAATAELSGVLKVVSFDRQIDRVPSVTRVEP